MSKTPDLDGAYALETPDDSVKLYADWSETYDESFASASGYQLPLAVAEAFLEGGGRGPVLDVGAGTGLVGVALHNRGLEVIDGVDISAQMLAEAALKDCYENLFEGDLTKQLSVDDETYSGVISAGTFTHGHVGPTAIIELLRVAAPGALFAITINAEHYVAKGFDVIFEQLGDQIQGLTLKETLIYSDARDDGHGGDIANIVTFTKA